MKKIHFAVLTAGLMFGASAFAFDGAIVKIPASNDHWFVGVEALYLQASDSNGDLDYSTTTNTTATPDSSNINSIDNSYQWAWRFIAGYEYGAANDVTLTYLHASPSDSDSVSGVSPNIIYNPNEGNSGRTYTSANGDVDYTLNQVDLTLGQKINLLRCITLHPFGGLRYARIERDLDSTFVNATTTTYTSDNSKFSGVGPLAGIDAAFDVGNGFKIVGHFDAGVLIGNMDESFDSSFTFGGTNTGITNVDVDSTRRVVSVIDARLGASYTYDMGNESALMFELGWQASAYNDAVDRVNTGSSIYNFAGGGSSTVPTRNTSDLGLNGPYLNLVYRI